jgi:nitrile hydratase accessory protein
LSEVERAPRRPPDRPPDLAERRSVDRLLGELPGAGAIPRREGELAFEEPWQLRALALAVAAHDQGRFPWPEFQRRLIAAIGDWERTPPEQRDDWEYYRHWVRALEQLVIDQGLAGADEIARKADESVKAGEHRRAHSHGGGLLAVDPGGR